MVLPVLKMRSLHGYVIAFFRYRVARIALVRCLCELTALSTYRTVKGCVAMKKESCICKIVLIAGILIGTAVSLRAEEERCPVSGCVVGQSPCLCMAQDQLMPGQIYSTGAKVNSVAWCCCDDVCILATGGNSRTVSPSPVPETVRLYLFNNATGDFNEVISPLSNPSIPIVHGANVNAVAWCCVGSKRYLAVGGSNLQSGTNPEQTGDVIVYVVDYTTSGGITISCVASYTHGAPVRALAWLCTPCGTFMSGNNPYGYLAIGGDPAGTSTTSIRILTFDGSQCQFISASEIDISTGTSINALDWCCRSGKLPLLAAGGRTTSDDDDGKTILPTPEPVVPGPMEPLDGPKPPQDGDDDTENTEDNAPNFFVYTFGVEPGSNDLGRYNCVTQGTFPGRRVRAVKWCCSEKLCTPFPPLAVGGWPSKNDPRKNLVVYLIKPPFNGPVEVASTTVDDNGLHNVRALAWNPTCDCNYLTFAGRCSSCKCDGNIVVCKLVKNEHAWDQSHNDDRKDDYKLEQVATTQFAQMINALGWAVQGRICSYLGVGANFLSLPPAPLQLPPTVGIYQASFCKHNEHDVDPCMRSAGIHATQE